MADSSSGGAGRLSKSGVKLAKSSPSRPSLFMSGGPRAPVLQSAVRGGRALQLMAIRSTPRTTCSSAVLLTAALLLAACGSGDPKRGGGGPGGSGGPGGPITVGYVVVQQGS